jgi:hypothetical protein
MLKTKGAEHCFTPYLSVEKDRKADGMNWFISLNWVGTKKSRLSKILDACSPNQIKPNYVFKGNNPECSFYTLFVFTTQS